MGVVNAVFIKPLDTAMLKELAEKYSFIVTVEDNQISGGLGESILYSLNELGYKGKVINLGYKDTYIEQGSVNLIYDDQGLSPRRIAEKIMSELNNG